MAKQIKYVVEDACVFCTKGTATTTLKATQKSETGTKHRIVETDTTTKSFNGNFGFCKTLMKPCQMKNLEKWFVTNENLISGDDTPCVTMESFLVCIAGSGAIMPLTDGQEIVSDSDIAKLLADRKKDTDTMNKQAFATYCGTLGEKANCLFGGDPINMATGNFIYSKNDIEIEGRFPIVFKRFYNSMDYTCGTLGKKWTHSYNTCLKEDESGDIKITYNDGRVSDYYVRGDGSYTPDSDFENTLIRSEDGYVLTIASTEKLFFDNQGSLIFVVDNNNNTTYLTYKDGLLYKVQNVCGSLELTYNKDFLIEKIVDHTGRAVFYQYEKSSLVSVTQPTGSVYRYEYDSSGLISNIINPLGITAIHNEYDELGRTIRQDYADGGTGHMTYDDDFHMTYNIEQNGNTVTYARDNDYRTTRVIYDDSEERFEYNEINKLSVKSDRNGNLRQFNYDDRGNLSEETNPMGGSTSTEYNELNKPVKITIPNGGTTSFEYDPKGNLIKSIDPLQREMQFTHNSQGLITGVCLPDDSKNTVKYDNRGNILAIIDAIGNKTQYEYDNLNNVVKAINGEGCFTMFEYNGKGNITKVTNAQGNLRQYEYNLSGKITQITDFDGGVIKYKYNLLGKVEEITNQSGGITKFTYDLMWNVTSVTNPCGNTVQYIYDQYQRVVQSIDENGNVTSYEHDPNGNVTAAISPIGARTEIKYNALDKQKEITGPDGATTKLDYDKVGNLVQVTDALGNVTKREYDLAGQLVALTDAIGNTTKFAYSPLGQVEIITNAKGERQIYSYYPGGKLKSFALPCGEGETYEYDKNGNIIKVTDALKNKTAFIYDQLDRVVEVVNPLGHSKKFAYDAVGNITHIIDEKGNKTQYKYSLLGDIIEVIDASGHSTKYDYDKAGRLTKFEQYRLIDKTYATSKCPEYQITTYERNKKGEVIAVKSPIGKAVKFGYDAVGNVISKLDEDNLETLYEYNLVGKLSKVSYADGKTVEFGYNALKQLTAMHDWLGTTKIELDELGRATRITDFEGKEVAYTWDSLGQKEKLVYPDGSEVKYEYNPSGKLQKVLSETGVTNYDYDAMGRISERILPNNATTTYELNPLGRLTNLTHSNDGNILDQFKYTHDPVGNITQIDKQRAGMEADSGLFQYTYDPLGRLCAAVRGDQVKRYRYDELGNRVRECKGHKYDTMEWTQHSYNARNQLIKTTEGDGVKEYRYDGRGNLTNITENNQVKAKYTFDATNMMVQAFSTGKGNAEYTYNGFKNRISKLETMQNLDANMPDPCSEIRYILDMTLPYDNLLTTQGEQNQNFVWGNGLLSASGEEKFYYLQDHLGSPIRLLGEQNSDTMLAYDEFGVPLIGAGKNANNPFGFTGYQTDDVSGFYYAQARYYEPKLGRFGAEDTHWNPENMIYGDNFKKMVAPSISALKQSGNLYAYCMSNPVSFMDPLAEALRWPGEVHSWVAKDIIENNSGRLSKERWLSIPYEGIDELGNNVNLYRPGRVDILDNTTGSIWEIKPASWPRDLAIKQLKEYENGVFSNKNIKHLKPEIYNGCPKDDGYKLSGHITKHRTGLLFNSTYEVDYEYTEDGIISYRFDEKLEPNGVTVAVGVSAFFAFGVYRFLTTGDPSGLQPAF